jgi:peptidoglycan/LPS O-acetylase OafA/YrhL
MRLTFLDSIRGLAALIVLTAHLHALSEPHALWFLDLWVLRTLKAAVFAVALFFVLSGFVLYLQIEDERVRYVRFVIRRAFRILPACIVAVTASYLIYLIWDPLPKVESRFLTEVMWPPRISFRVFLNHLYLGGSTDLLPPIWSLIVEWRVSLIFPILVLLFRLSPGLLAALALSWSIVIAHVPVGIEVQGFTSATMIAFYACLFVLGIFIGAFRFHLILLLRSNRWLRVALLIICIYFICFRSESVAPAGYLQQGLLAGAFIIVCMSTAKVRRILRSPQLQYLGRISYSLYLVHMLGIATLFRLMPEIHPIATATLTIVTCLVAADLLNRFVEAPANRLGRKIASLGLPHQASSTIELYRARSKAPIDGLTEAGPDSGNDRSLSQRAK